MATVAQDILPSNKDNIEALCAQVHTLLLERDISEAFAQANQLCQQYPQSPAALTALASCHYGIENYHEVLGYTIRVLSMDPQNGLAYQLHGHVHFNFGLWSLAETAYINAVGINPHLAESWHKLSVVSAKLGKSQAALEALLKFRVLNGHPASLQAIENALLAGNLSEAAVLCNSLLRENPQHADAKRLLACAHYRQGNLAYATGILRQLLSDNENDYKARFDYIRVLNLSYQIQDAYAQAKILNELRPDERHTQSIFADQCTTLGLHDEALALYDKILAKQSNLPFIHLQRGNTLKALGKPDEANLAYRQAYTHKSDYGDAYWSLANMKTYSFTDEEISSMKSAESSEATHLQDRIHLCFALGKAFEDKKDFDQSFSFYNKGNTLKRSISSYSIDHNRLETENKAQRFSTDFFTRFEDAGHKSDAPIFIVGLPRSGSTLLEQILASHSQVESTFELFNITSIAADIEKRGLLKGNGEIDSETLKILHEYGEKYLEDTKAYRTNKPYFIDKLPNNFQHIGIIQLILPNAKIIDARRHPLSCCFSGFKQLFAPGFQEFSYGLEEISHYYKDYIHLMDHWDVALENKVLRVHYEDVVRDTESQIRRMLDYCGLPFEESCLGFHTSSRAVRTPSAEQVRQPIFSSGMDQWKNYDAFLGPARDALSDIVKSYEKVCKLS